MLTAWGTVFDGTDTSCVFLPGVAVSTNLSLDFEDFFVRPEATLNRYPLAIAPADYIQDMDVAYVTIGLGGGIRIR